MPTDRRPAAALDKNALLRAVERYARYGLGQRPEDLSARECFGVLGMAVREPIIDAMLQTQRRIEEQSAKRVAYLSMEFLVGRSLRANVLNMLLDEPFREAAREVCGDMEEIERLEPDAALGNGGLGRLAAAFLESLATLDLPAIGYGINYEYGLFRQKISGGAQEERPDHWRDRPTPWLIERHDEACPVPLRGWVEDRVDEQGTYRPRWIGWQMVRGVPSDMPIVGYGGRTVHPLRLYAARSSSQFDMEIFNEGDFFKAVESKMQSETISKALYPPDIFEEGRELRLTQEYFLVACAVRDVFRRLRRRGLDDDRLPDYFALQMNDTHPALAVAEIMRLLVDERDVPWETAWDLTRRTCAFTNHTLMPEALEKWPVDLFGRLLPRHLQIIYEINSRFLDAVQEDLGEGDAARLERLSIVEEGPDKKLRMANLAVVGSHAVNGVAALHSELVKTRLFPDFYALFPDRFQNKTNGVTPRRWLLQANPDLAELFDETVGPGWVTDLEKLAGLDEHAEDAAFQERFREIKRANKQRLADAVSAVAKVPVDAEMLFDVHVKRIHEYKRQLLKVLHVVHDYLALADDGKAPDVPRVFVFAGKAAPGYWIAQQIIKLIHGVAEVVNRDSRARDHLRVVFLPDYRVTLAERIIPAADLSEQISTAGTEASGTGNMKLAMNGALTVGTRDGANIEIRDAVGEENFYEFGMTVEEIRREREAGGYDPWRICKTHGAIERVLRMIDSGRFSPGASDLFNWVHGLLLENGDYYRHLADMPSYLEAQRRVDADYARPEVWTAKAIRNVARMGGFSSDRTVREYARDIWNLKPLDIDEPRTP